MFLAASILNSPAAVGGFLIVLGTAAGAVLVAFSRQRLNNSTLQSETLQAYEADRALKTGQITDLTSKVADLEHRVTEQAEKLAQAQARNTALEAQMRQMAPIDALAREVGEMRREINAGVVAICERMDDHKGSIEAVRTALDLMHALLQFFGINSGSGHAYFFWSGAGSDIGELAIVGAILGMIRVHNCHVKGCMRIGHHPVDGTPYKVCRIHHPGVPDGGPTAEHVADAHWAANR